ncbi:Uncharacterized protein HZ326_24168 [Fusarium oxysporum f. sp. albedinis]|nr:Uncharacterized protein HZ326_24168 [Fusarium oxysporum f. sp. albedinis]
MMRRCLIQETDICDNATPTQQKPLPSFFALHYSNSLRKKKTKTDYFVPSACILSAVKVSMDRMLQTLSVRYARYSKYCLLGKPAYAGQHSRTPPPSKHAEPDLNIAHPPRHPGHGQCAVQLQMHRRCGRGQRVSQAYAARGGLGGRCPS